MDTVWALHQVLGHFATPRRCDEFIDDNYLVCTTSLDADADIDGQCAWLAHLQTFEYEKPDVLTGLIAGLEHHLDTNKDMDEPCDADLELAAAMLNIGHARLVFSEINEPCPEGVVRPFAQYMNIHEIRDRLFMLYNMALAQAEHKHMVMTSNITPEMASSVIAGMTALRGDDKVVDYIIEKDIAEFCEMEPSSLSETKPLDMLDAYVKAAEATMHVAVEMEP